MGLVIFLGLHVEVDSCNLNSYERIYDLEEHLSSLVQIRALSLLKATVPNPLTQAVIKFGA